ncbi:MAG TPA: C40 family peptidase [Burkholderiaceae bacterium]|nr:C40 family peptidase [Burkholderiaceae bacterium]
MPQYVRRFLFPGLVAVLTLLAGCASTPRHESGAGYWRGQPVVVDQSKRTDVVMMALAQLDTRYRYGGDSPDTGFDCSGLVDYVFKAAADAGLPHNTARIAEISRPISRRALSPGDLVFFNTLNRRYSHMGIYLGHGRFINAPSSGGVVRIDSLNSRYYARRFDGARTLFAAD